MCYIHIDKCMCECIISLNVPILKYTVVSIIEHTAVEGFYSESTIHLGTHISLVKFQLSLITVSNY